MHSPDEPKLVEGLKKFANPLNIIVNNETQYILDGDNLIYKMRNRKKKTSHFPTNCYAVCCLCHAKFRKECCNSDPQKLTTKDHVHISRAQSTGLEPHVEVTTTTKLAIKENHY